MIPIIVWYHPEKHLASLDSCLESENELTSDQIDELIYVIPLLLEDARKRLYEEKRKRFKVVK